MDKQIIFSPAYRYNFRAKHRSRAYSVRAGFLYFIDGRKRPPQRSFIMKQRKAFFVFAAVAAFVAGLALAGCASSSSGASTATAKPSVDLTGVTSWYVNAAIGADSNAGTSEAAPFKTLQKAVDAAAATAVKKITVIGKVTGETNIKNTDATVRKLNTFIDERDGNLSLDRPKTLLAEAMNGEDPDTITITGFAPPNSMKQFANDKIVRRWGLWDCGIQGAMGCYMAYYIASGHQVKVGDKIDIPEIGTVEVMPNTVLDPKAYTADDSGVVLLPERVVFTTDNMNNYNF
jgi:hypothetical protein